MCYWHAIFCFFRCIMHLLSFVTWPTKLAQSSWMSGLAISVIYQCRFSESPSLCICRCFSSWKRWELSACSHFASCIDCCIYHQCCLFFSWAVTHIVHDTINSDTFQAPLLILMGLWWRQCWCYFMQQQCNVQCKQPVQSMKLLATNVGPKTTTPCQNQCLTMLTFPDIHVCN